MMKNYFLIMAAVGVIPPLIGEFFGPDVSGYEWLFGIIWIGLFWGLPSYYLKWCLHKRDVEATPTNILYAMEDEWTVNGPFQKRSELHHLRMGSDIGKLEKGLERLQNIQEELVNRYKSPPLSDAGKSLLKRMQESAEGTRMQLEQLRKHA